MRRLKLTITTAADGSATAYSPRVAGKIHSVQYVKTDYADGVDFTVTCEATGENIWTESNVNASAVRYPRAATHSQAGVAALYASGGTAVMDKVAIASDRIKVVIAAGGNAKTGALHILVDE
ncbi:hypothetical protein [Azorhizobium sp. AG788]|uniref:hypothetical protein n=1 Tax=Azorhizobium sp. AG788 TaxID=2183897 RepID=UPI003139D193